MVAPQPAAVAPVLILGAGVNGLCVARELAINGVPTVVVDTADLGGGATAKSSRLIHGGLRYLEYGEFRLVRESLDERTRLLKLAPHWVRPLQLHIPVRRRRGGLVHAAIRFLGLGRVAWLQRGLSTLGMRAERGRWAAQFGLWMYDWIARRGDLPQHTVASVGDASSPPFDRDSYRWICSYWDAQMLAPERFCVALARDAAQGAVATGTTFELLTYHQAQLAGDGVELSPTLAREGATRPLQPAMIVNATGAWGDLTLKALPVAAPQLFGGTRGSHILTQQPQLRGAIGDAGIYAEAPDGRLVFLLPWGDAVLVGTTDERFQGAPEDAVTTAAEITYLVGMVNLVLPQVQLQETDVLAHYSGVRPLPFVPTGKTAAISRDHAIDTRTTSQGLRIDTLVGGKLTTCRALGEQAADRILTFLGRTRIASTANRPLPGSANYPGTRAACDAATQTLCPVFRLSPAGAEAVWELFGDESASILSSAGLARGEAGSSTMTLLAGTPLPLAVVDWIIRHEYVRTVADLVERRLQLVFSPARLRLETLEVLEQRIREIQGRCDQGADAAAVRLQRHYGVTVS
jgi:glycerol-3-phosphate dehydrogenase